MKKILLVMIGLSVGLMADFVRDANTKIVSDSVTGLEWQDDEIGKVKTWQSAIDRCENLTLDGSGWRLPNINELKSILDKDRVNPAIANAFTQTDITYYYWSSTEYNGYEDGAWVVDFYDGSARSNYKGTTLFVRCVRTGE
ncbi:MAG: DUF1566 domain-containing protein [Campylobacterales bacterium]|nr:DUF1566 domain-containing protein [Campylobacterales bacterium]